MSPDQFAGKRSLVTGAARGIGRAVVERLAAEGSYVIVADLDGSEAEAVACAVPRGAAEALQLDVADKEWSATLQTPSDRLTLWWPTQESKHTLLQAN